MLVLFGDMGVGPVPWHVLHQARESCLSFSSKAVSVLQGASMTEEQEGLHWTPACRLATVFCPVCSGVLSTSSHTLWL